MKKSLQFETKLWLYPGESGNWHFVSVPKSESAKWREEYKGKHRGWNSIKVEVSIGKTVWQTSIFFDTRSGQYILPIKAKVRKVEGLFTEDVVKVKLKII